MMEKQTETFKYDTKTTIKLGVGKSLNEWVTESFIQPILSKQLIPSVTKYRCVLLGKAQQFCYGFVYFCCKIAKSFYIFKKL